jgi:outer membrane protein insertion porin family
MNAKILLSRCTKVLALVGLGVTAISASAADSFVVRDIRLEGLQRIEPGTVFSYLPIKQGDTFSDDKASEAIRALYATGFFNDVKITTEGDAVIVQLVERPAIGTIDFAGIHEFDKDNLIKALNSVGLSLGSYYDKALVDKSEQELKRQYLTRGYYAAEVTTTVTPIDRNRVGILFSVGEDPRDQLHRQQGVQRKHAARRNAAVHAELVLVVYEERSVLERQAHRRPRNRPLVLPESRLSGVQH